MKTEIIKQNIIDNYNQLSQMAKVQNTDKNYIKTWGLNYRNGMTSGHVNELGFINRNSSTKIRITDRTTLELDKKPFYLTWTRALKNINRMLEDTIANYNNNEVVSKRVLSILCFPKEAADRLSKAANKAKIKL